MDEGNNKDKKSNLSDDYMLIKGEDYYLDNMGRYVFTSEYLLKRGYCCESGCLHCPYGFRKDKDNK